MTWETVVSGFSFFCGVQGTPEKGVIREGADRVLFMPEVKNFYFKNIQQTDNHTSVFLPVRLGGRYP